MPFSCLETSSEVNPNGMGAMPVLTCFHPSLIHTEISFDDLVEYRKQSGRLSPFPLQIIFTRSAKLIIDCLARHRIVTEGQLPIFIATTDKVVAQVKDLPWLSSSSTSSSSTAQVCSFGSEHVDFQRLFCHLRQSLDIRYLDISAGGQILSSLIQSRLLDELRRNQSALICGGLTTRGETRPILFPSSENITFTAQNSPLLEHIKVRTFGRRFLFTRSRITYRHGQARGQSERIRSGRHVAINTTAIYSPLTTISIRSVYGPARE